MAITLETLQAHIDSNNVAYGIGLAGHVASPMAHVSRLEKDGSVSHFVAEISIMFTGETYESRHNGVTLLNAYATLQNARFIAQVGTGARVPSESLLDSISRHGTFVIDTDGIKFFL